MNLLSIDTVTENCSVALGMNGQVTELSEMIPYGHSRRLHAMVRELLDTHQVKLNQLDAIAVDIGPGSFTGVRIGIGVAQGLAFASGIPAIAVGSLAALAEPYRGGLVVSAIDARMRQVYWGMFDTRDGVLPLMEPMVSDPRAVPEMTFDVLTDGQFSDFKACGVGSGWRAYEDLMPANNQFDSFQIFKQDYPTAASVSVLAEKEAPVNAALLTAAYVRNNVAKKSTDT